MNALEPILAYHYFVRHDPDEARSLSHVRLLFDTNIVYSTMIGLSDYFSGTTNTKERTQERWFNGYSSLLSAILVDRMDLLDMMEPHRLELVHLLRTKDPDINPLKALQQLFSTDLVPSFVERHIDYNAHSGEAEFKINLEKSKDTDLEGLKALVRIASLAEVNSKTQMGRLGSRFSKLGMNTKEVSEIVADPIYLRAFEIYEEVTQDKTAQARAIDCASIVYLADLVAAFNKGDQSPDNPAPFFLCDPEASLFNTLLKLSAEEEFCSRLVIRNAKTGVRAFAFQSGLLLSLINAYSVRGVDPNAWPLLDDAASDLQGFMAEPGPTTEDEKVKEEVYDPIVRDHWLTIMERMWPHGEMIRLEGRLSTEVRYKAEEVRAERLELATQVKRAIPHHAQLARKIAWNHRAIEAAETLKTFFQKHGIENHNLLTFLRLYDYGFGRGDDLANRLQEASKAFGGDYGKALRRLVLNAWNSYERDIKERKLSEGHVTEETHREIEYLAILIWIVSGSDLDLAERRDHRKFISEILDFYSATGADLPAWCVCTLIRLADVEYGAAMARKEHAEALKYVSKLESYTSDLERRWNNCVTQSEFPLIGFPFTQALLHTGKAISETRSDSPAAERPADSIFSQIDNAYWRKSIDVAKCVKSSLVARSADSGVCAYADNQLLYALSCSTASLVGDDVQLMHLTAGDLKRASREAPEHWFWHYDDTMAVYCIKIAECMRASGDAKSQQHWLKRARNNVEGAITNGADPERARVVEDAIEERMSVLAVP